MTAPNFRPTRNALATIGFLFALGVAFRDKTVSRSTICLRGITGRFLESHDIDEVEQQYRIINGETVTEDRFQYFSLMYGINMCGAALIGPRLALGAAHCAHASTSLWIGAQDGRQSGLQVSIKDVIVHQDYDKKDIANDIALFYLENAVDIPYIQPDPTDISGIDLPLTVIGFGDMIQAPEETRLSNQLLEVQLQYVDNAVCDEMHGGRGDVTEDMLCAAGDTGDSCGGDSGGPLLVKGSDMSQDRLVGIVSWGRSCNDKRYPGVYTRISHMYGWIIETSCTLFPDDTPDYMLCEAESVRGMTGAPTSASLPSKESILAILVNLTISPTPAPSPKPSLSPTRAPSVPSPKPSLSPTRAPSIHPIGNSDENASSTLESDANVIELVTWTVQSDLLKACKGDCDSDADCAPGLKCFSRSANLSIYDVPGCVTLKYVDPNVDVCYNATLANPRSEALKDIFTR